MKTENETTPRTEAEQLADLERQIARGAAAPELTQIRYNAKGAFDTAAERAQRLGVEATRAKLFLADAESAAGKAAVSAERARVSVERLECAVEGWSRILLFDEALAACEFLVRTSASKILSRKVAAEGAVRKADAASGEAKLALADFQKADRDLAAVLGTNEALTA